MAKTSKVELRRSNISEPSSCFPRVLADQSRTLRLRLRNRIGRSVTCHALFGRGLIEDYGLSRDIFRQFVAISTTHILVRPAQREGGSDLVVKQRRFPFHAVVTFNTARDRTLGKLLSVDIFVTVFTLHRRGPEIHVDQFGFQVGRLMAVDAGGRPMRACQQEFGFRMVEGGKFFPRFRGVTSFTASDGSICANLLHAFKKLALVRIRMATRAIQVLPAINDGRLRLKRRRFPVTVGTRHGNVSSGENKVRVLVAGQGEGRRLIRFQAVAALTGVEIRRSRKLSGMTVTVAICTAVELDLE